VGAQSRGVLDWTRHGEVSQPLSATGPGGGRRYGAQAFCLYRVSMALPCSWSLPQSPVAWLIRIRDP